MSLRKRLLIFHLVVLSMFGKENDFRACGYTDYYVSHHNYRVFCCASYTDSMESCESGSSESAYAGCYGKLSSAFGFILVNFMLGMENGDFVN